MKQRRILLALAFLALVFVGALLFSSRGSGEVERWKAEARQRGERLTLEELKPAWSSNVFDYQRRFSNAVRRLQFTPVPPSMVELVMTTAVGRARLAWRQPLPTSMATSGNTWRNLMEQIDGSAEPLAEIHGMLPTWPRGLQWDPSRAVDSQMINLMALRKAAQFLSIATVGELNRGRLDAALTNIHSLLALSGLSRDGGTLVETMISAAVAGLTDGACWETLQAPGWDDSRLLALQTGLQQVDLVVLLARTMETERGYGLAYLDYARRNGRKSKNIGPSVGFNSSQPLVEGINDYVFMPMWQRKWSHHDELLYLQRMQGFVDIARALTNQGSWCQQRNAITASSNATPTALDSFRYPVHEAVIPSMAKAMRVTLRYETRRQLLLAAIALKRAQLRRGALPASLDELVPELLPALPRDWQSGRPLHYRRDADETFTLYAEGENGLDEGGAGDDQPWMKAE